MTQRRFLIPPVCDECFPAVVFLKLMLEPLGLLMIGAKLMLGLKVVLRLKAMQGLKVMLKLKGKPLVLFLYP
jgi:hypothetical protein